MDHSSYAAWRYALSLFQFLAYGASLHLIRIGVLGNVERNRALVRRAREVLGLARLGESICADDSAWSESSSIYYSRMSLIPNLFLFVPLLQFAEGQPLVAPAYLLSQGIITAYYCFPRKQDRVPYIYMLHGFALFQSQLLIFMYPDSLIPLLIVDRIMVIRCLQPLLSIEVWDVPLIHFVLNSITMACRRAEHPGVSPFASSMTLFFVINLPTTLLSMRGTVVSQIVQTRPALVYLFSGLPIIAIFSGLSFPKDSHFVRARMFMGIVCLIASVLLTYTDMMPRETFVKSWHPKDRFHPQIKWSEVLATSSLSVIRLLLLDLTLRYAVPSEAWHSIFYVARVPLHGMACLLLVKSELRYMAETAMIIGITLFTLPDKDTVAVHVALATLVCICNVLILSGRNDAESKIQAHSDADNFVSHAIKQKFVGCGTALQYAISIGRTTSPEAQALVMPLLTEAYNESLFGYQLCLFVSVARKIHDGSYVPSIQSLTTANVARIWAGRLPSKILVSALEKDNGNDVLCILAPWDLLWTLVTKLLPSRGRERSGSVVLTSRPRGANRGRQLSRNVLDQSKDVEVIISLSGMGDLRTDRYTDIVLSFLQASLMLNGTLVIPATRDLDTGNNLSRIRGTSKSSSSSSAIELPGGQRIPKGLCFAVLDDNLLSRRLLQRFITDELKAASVSFCAGDTLKEALSFTGRVMQLQCVDAVILDQHLDYDERMILGSELAQDLRRMGFRGCVILHTANDAVLDNLDRAVFDGGISKSMSNDFLISGFLQAWNNRVQRLDASKKVR